MRILVVEDEPRLNELIVKQLNAMHYSVDACLRGDDALDYISGAEYDVIVLDIMLPGISGLDILRTLRIEEDSLDRRYLPGLSHGDKQRWLKESPRTVQQAKDVRNA